MQKEIIKKPRTLQKLRGKPSKLPKKNSQQHLVSWTTRITSSSQLLPSSSSSSQPSSSLHQPLSSAQLSPPTISTVNDSPENQNENIDELKLHIKRLEKELTKKNSTIFALQNQLLSIDKKNKLWNFLWWWIWIDNCFVSSRVWHFIWVCWAIYKLYGIYWLQELK